MKHREKLRLGRRMRTADEIKRGVGAFDSVAWNSRHAAIEARVKRKEDNAKLHAQKKKDATEMAPVRY